MKLWYFRTRRGNFGDDLNGFIWEPFLGRILDDDAQCWLVGIGTLLGHGLLPSGNKLICGTGAGYRRPPHITAEWRVSFVRGPLTARRIGLLESSAVLDPAYLVREFYPRSVAKRLGVTFIPHHEACRGVRWDIYCRAVGVRFISPCSPPFHIIDAIRQSSFVVSEAMHGCIVADALGIPWIPAVVFSNINSFKWLDWTASIGVPYAPLTNDRLIPLKKGSFSNTVLRNLIALRYSFRILKKPLLASAQLSRIDSLDSRYIELRRRLARIAETKGHSVV